MKDKWEEFDKGIILFDLPQKHVCVITREAYKAALRAEIEERIKWFENVCPPTYHGRNFKLAELNNIIDLLDTIPTPRSHTT